VAGFLVIDASLLDGPEQAGELADRIHAHKGWQHPDGRWVLPLEYPTFARDRWIREGWPAEALVIP
jgi:hypothetical protein